jgi:uncharacterized protein (DUF305 family)
MHTTTTARLSAPLLALALALTACGDDGSASGDAAADHNDQDVAFATDMIPHHAQAVAMTELAADRAGSDEVRTLAAEIEAAQAPEIEQMSSWLEAWGEEVPDASADGMGGMDHGETDHDDMGDMGGMAGMMSPRQMADLADASGAQFDELFLTLMIEHHEGAIEMAEIEQADGENAEAVELAEAIEQTQAEEIETMEELLGSR